MKKSLFIIAALVITSLSYGQDKVFAPTLVSPADSAVNQMADVFVDFTAVAGAQLYEIQFDSSDVFSNPLKVFASYSAGNAVELLYNTFYHWRVRAIGNPGDTSAWSAVRTFSVIDIPVIVYPIDSTGGHAVAPTFVWEEITGSNGYAIMIDTLNDFSSPMAMIVTADAIDTAKILLNYYGEEFYYKIRAYHSKDTTDWTAVTYFITRNSPVLQTPADSVVDALPTVQLQFKGILGSDYYEYEYSTFSDFSASTFIYVPLTAQSIINPANVNTRDTVVKVIADTLPFAQMIYWRARAINAVDTSDWSTEFRINIIPDVKILYKPAEGTTVATTKPKFIWKKISGVTGYELEYSTDPTFISDVEFAVVPHPTTLHDSVFYAVPSNLDENTMYYWRVRAYNNRYNSNWKDSYFTSGTNTAIADFSLDNNLSIYPNPCKGKLNVQISTQHSMEYIIIINNIVGQTVLSKSGTLSSGKNTLPFNMEELTNGIYFISVQTGEQDVTRKIILEK
jgi:hypothetical protein